MRGKRKKRKEKKEKEKKTAPLGNVKPGFVSPRLVSFRQSRNYPIHQLLLLLLLLLLILLLLVGRGGGGACRSGEIDNRRFFARVAFFFSFGTTLLGRR